jgi:hypothetical protein
MSAPLSALVLAGLAWLAWYGRHYQPPKRPRRAPEPGPAGQVIGEVVAGSIGLAGALGALLVPLAILAWLVSK